ncbi:MAG: glycogen synthase GlgA [Candidatus Omnitrophota bacterium]|nr:glycogen synthase GlgA [Candidatus Omnitrophota bacterium]
MKIVLVSPEVAPFAKTGGLADVSGALPVALNNFGKAHKCTVIMPYYKLVQKNGFKPKLVRTERIPLGNNQFNAEIFFGRYENTDVYFIGNDQFYARDQLYGTPGGDYPDNHLRFAFFAKAVVSVIDYLGGADIVHCNDWQSALVIFYLKLLEKEHRIKTLFTIHNMAYQGLFDPSLAQSIDIPPEYFSMDTLEFYGKLSFMKAGILYADAVSTVSKGYAKEILTPEFGCGLDGLLRSRLSSLYGILNGADYNEWNPKIDKYIAKNFDEHNLDGKTECKKDLLKAFGLKYDAKKPVLGLVTRLAEQKGIDLIAERIEQMLDLGTYFILLGTGSEKYNNLFSELAKKHHGSVGVRIGFDNSLAHKIEAGSDMFLMPSRYEPCGLNQMYSLKYGTVPLVRATGGLDDTIEDFNPANNKGNGFKFVEASAEAFYTTLERAVNLYKDKKKWLALQKNGLKCDFSWNKSAGDYVELFEKILFR